MTRGVLLLPMVIDAQIINYSWTLIAAQVASLAAQAHIACTAVQAHVTSGHPLPLSWLPPWLLMLRCVVNMCAHRNSHGSGRDTPLSS